MSNTDFEEEGEEEEIEIDLIGKYLGGRNTLNERHGKGWAILPNLDQYDGDYKRGQRHGNGLYVFRNGARYYGSYRCGSKSGKGKFVYPDGSIYDGEWRKNVKHGYGIYTYANGDVYKGNWYKDKRHGLGIYIYKAGDVCFKGTWNQGIQVGPAELHFKTHKLHGTWDYQYPQGPTVYTFACKFMQNGYYKSDVNIKPLINEVVNVDEYENEMEEEMSETNEHSEKYFVSPSLWYAQDIDKYDYSKLPQQPVPLPISDSEESICYLSESSVSLEPPVIEMENMEECESTKIICEEGCEECPNVATENLVKANDQGNKTEQNDRLISGAEKKINNKFAANDLFNSLLTPRGTTTTTLQNDEAIPQSMDEVLENICNDQDFSN